MELKVVLERWGFLPLFSQLRKMERIIGGRVVFLGCAGIIGGWRCKDNCEDGKGKGKDELKWEGG